jgi:Mg-chelatase subunit ChlD
MTLIILTLILLLVLWIAAGMVLLFRKSGAAGNDYRRSVDRRVYTAGEEVEVSLRFVPPARVDLAADHDVLLAIDHSSSMGSAPGSPLREAIRAAENFTRRLPDNIHLGIMEFDHEAHVLSSLTANRAESLRAIASIGPGGGTAIHLAVDHSAGMLRTGRDGVKKILILLSDGSSDLDSSITAAQQLRREIANSTIISVGVGPHVNESVLRAIASDPTKYVHVDSATDLHDLFSLLANAVSGELALTGLVDEGARAPHPFRLTQTGGLYPVGVQPQSPAGTEGTRIVWSIPVMTTNTIPVTYQLVSECPGWHKVAADSNSTWRMPDGSQIERKGPNGPYVLIMPRWLGWTWPVLNPLFWILAGRFWRCRMNLPEKKSLLEPAPLQVATLPQLPPVPNEPAYQSRVRPAVVIGLGEVGEWTLCRLKERISDREVDPAGVSLLSIHVTHEANRKPVRVMNTVLDESERVDLYQDLRPYLETLRSYGTSPLRHWVPWREWLAESTPLTTQRTVNDRRKARLAIVRRPESIEERLAPGLDHVLENEGLVIVVGSMTDPECSGLLAEVAHICAARGAGVTTIFAPTSFFERSTAAELALALELERLSLMSGSQVVSDRHEPPVAARQLFDRIVVLDQKQETVREASEPTAELLWALLAYEDVSKQLPVLRSYGDETVCTVVDLSSHRIPAASLWAWVRERTLAFGINSERLQLSVVDGKLVFPEIDRDLVNDDVDSFWSGRAGQRPQSVLLQRLRPSVVAEGSNAVSTLLALQEVVPTSLLYHEQVIHARNEREVFAAYLEEWCQQILVREAEKGVWGVHVLLPALIRVVEDMRLGVDNIKRLSGNPDFTNIVSLASGLLIDFLKLTSDVQDSLSQWLAQLVGPRVELGVGVLPAGKVPLAYDIEYERQRTETLFDSLDTADQQLLNEWFQDWYAKYGDVILDQLDFRVARDGDRVSVDLYSSGRALSDRSQLAQEVRTKLDSYRSIVIAWPFEKMLKREALADATQYLRIGKHSLAAYPGVREAIDEDDPFVSVALRVRELPLKQAFGVNPPPPGEVPYIWPEEANAARISQKYRNRLRREPQPFTPTVVHLMRDVQKLYGFFCDVALGRVSSREGKFYLARGNQEYEIGPTDERLQDLEAFQSVVHQVVSYEVSVDGRPLPPPPVPYTMSFADTITAIETHSLGKLAAKSPHWQMWQDVIHGLVLECNP